jgi:hypothetical protein
MPVLKNTNGFEDDVAVGQQFAHVAVLGDQVASGSKRSG